MTENTTQSPQDTNAQENGDQAQQANKIVKRYVKSAVVLGLVPMPLVDIVAISAAQLKMIHSLAQHYDQPFSKAKGKYVISALVGGIMPTSLKQGLLSLSKSFPLVGQAIGLAGVPIVAGATTYAVGQVMIQHFESGGTLLEFDAEKMREYYQQQKDKGQTVAEQSYAGMKP